MEEDYLEETIKENEKVKSKQEGLDDKKIEEQVENQDEKVEFKKVERESRTLRKDMKEMYQKKRKTKATIIISIILVIIALIILSTIFAILNINNENLISGISISGVDVSGLSKKEAMEKMKTIYDEKKEKEIELKYEDYETSLNPTLLEVNYDIEKAVDKAYLTGRNSNIFINNYNILFTILLKKNINIEINFNEEVARQTIQDIGVNLPGVIIDSSYSVEGEELVITKGKEGIAIDTDLLLEKVKNNLKIIDNINDYLDIPVLNKVPETIDIQKIHDEIYKEVQDAYYTKDPFTIYPEVEGVDFDIEAAKKILEEQKDEYVIPLIITKPKVTINDIGTEAFPDQLATFTTRYDVSDVDRSTNLVIACQKINDKVVLAGETFSYNQALGARTAAAGYKNAKVYENGQVVDGIGGGICQISSTLYNSILMANLEVVERRNHQFVTSYLPAGRDATVVYGMTDFKFKNTRKYPIRIVASARNGIATVSIYGIKEENEYTFTFSTKTVASIPFTTKYVEDNTLAVGTEKVKQKGANGLKTETYITKMLDGKVISTRLLSKDTYDAMTRIVLKGTKGATTTTKTETKSNDSTNSKSSTESEKTKTDETKADETKTIEPADTTTTTSTTNTINVTNTTNTTNTTVKE